MSHFENGIMVDSDLYPEAIEIKPMKYRKEPDEDTIRKLLATHNYIGQIKKDGIHQILQKTKSGYIYAWARTVSKKTGELTMKIDHIPHIKKWMKSLPNDTIVAGELYFPGKTSKDVSRVMGALTDKAISRQASDQMGKIHYYLFDLLRWDGQDMMNVDFEKRYSDLCLHIDIERTHPNYIEIAPSLTGFDALERAQRLIDVYHEEGVVFKRKMNGPYQPDKRPSYNFKYKKHRDSLDFIVTEILPPETIYDGKDIESWQYYQSKDVDGFWNNLPIGKHYEVYKTYGQLKIRPVTKACYMGWAGAIRVGLYDRDELVSTGRVASGLTDEDKQDLAENPDKYIGSVVSVNCMELDKNEHTFRHPYKIAWRFDKDAKDCTIESIFG